MGQERIRQLGDGATLARPAPVLVMTGTITVGTRTFAIKPLGNSAPTQGGDGGGDSGSGSSGGGSSGGGTG